MTQDLTVAEFSRFFEEIHGHPPFPWQIRLIKKIAAENTWPEVLDLPTGSGKTSALDIAVFHLALEADRGSERRAPVRIALVVDRRLVVDDAFGRAEKIAAALANPEPGTVTAVVAQRLRLLVGQTSPALLAHRLRGGIPREDDWARSYLVDFLDLPDKHSEADLQTGLLRNLRRFLMELGDGFAFVGEKVRVQVGNQDFELDLLFYHRDLQCLVAFELKTGRFEPEHMGKLAFYLEALDRDRMRSRSTVTSMSSSRHGSLPRSTPTSRSSPTVRLHGSCHSMRASRTARGSC